MAWQDGSEVIRVTFKGAEPQDAKKIVDAVQTAFMQEVIQKAVNEKKMFLKQVEDEQLKLKNNLTLQAQKPAAPGVAVPPGATPPAAAGMLPGEIMNRLDPRILISKLATLQQEVERLPLTIRDLQRRQEVLREKMELLKKAPIPQATHDMIDKDPEVVTQKLRVIRAKSEYEFRKNAGDPNAPRGASVEGGLRGAAAAAG